MKKRSTLFICLALAAALLFTACGKTQQPKGDADSTASTQNITLKIGASPAPHAEILEQVKPILAQQGITLDIVEFNDYIIPNTALKDGDIEANYFQHLPYLEDFNEKNNADLVSAAAIHFEPLGIYAGKTDSLDALKNGAQIGIPNDTTNEARALYLLEAQGLITLKDGIGFEATPADIEDNPHNFKFIELEAAQIPPSLPDLDIAVINGNYAVGSGVADAVLVTEDKDSEAAQTYANIIAVRPEDKDSPEIKALIDALQTDEVREFIEEKFDGVVVTVF